MVAEEPVEPQLLAQLLEIPVGRGRASSARELAAEYEAEDRGFVLVRGRRRLPLPEPPRPGALRRAVRARGPVGPAVGRRARDAGHRRLQAADVAGPGGGHPRRQRRRRDAHAPAAGLHRRGRPAIPGPGQAVLFGTTAAVPRAARPRLARRPAAARRVRARRRRGRGASSTACGPTRPTTIGRADDDADDGGRRASTPDDERRGCPARRGRRARHASRRSWPGPGSAAGGRART